MYRSDISVLLALRASAHRCAAGGAGTLAGMSSRPQPTGGPLPRARGEVDYRLSRQRILRQYEGGRLGRLDVCDAHPELMRAARAEGRRTARPCPICEESEVVLVSYAFGKGLPKGGAAVRSKADVARLARKAGEIACYVVEVCPECAWNHLERAFSVGNPPAR